MDVLAPSVTIKPPKKGSIYDWLGDVYVGSRGLATLGDCMLATTLPQQSASWDALGAGYISDVIVIMHTFFENGLAHVCKDDLVREGIKSLTRPMLLACYEKTIHEVQRTLHAERHATPSTQNKVFNDELRKWSVDNLP